MNKLNKSILICSTIFCATIQAGIVDDIFSSNFQYDTVLAGTSFEEPVFAFGPSPEGKYFDTGSEFIAHDLINNTNQNVVDITGTSELDFDASWIPYDDFVDPYDPNETIPGMVDGDWVGPTTYTPYQSVYTDGLQGYQISDPDGTFILVSESVNLTERVNNSMSIDYFLSDTTWEIDDPSLGNNIRNDGVRIYAENMVSNARYYILDTLTDNIMTIIDINDLGIVGAWQNGSVMLPDDVMVRLVIEYRSGSGNEKLFLDNVKFKGSD